MNSKSRQGQTALITGGGSGIGLAIAQRLHGMGMRVVIASRRLDLLTKAAERLNQDGRDHAFALAMDVRDRQSVVSALAELPMDFADVDVLVNNAGLGVEHTLADCPEEEWDRVINTTLKGPFLVTQALLPQMQKRGDGFILNIASQAAKHGYAKAGPYCAAKFGLMGFAKALQEEVRPFGIRVHNLMPALVQVPAPDRDTDQLSGWLQTEDLADAAEYVLTRPERVFLEDIGLMGQ
ncbi:SDR family oxidoreductase [Reinekea blandensis]|uniref:Oxidoreductase, short-chain dehydrogenase/reductase family protein n=1 Tax=Reinekea blandensis MED297 TaxID=314283 RepID=A4BEY4_9GAMM|nr:SDR family oxidoreductase [Reinekea blandensis]EAR09319.1 oxidoreductase, short-chain dehydrogenase/reductase family protein [Reinekea sp. MED297] [Reinekea blandensis MED297]